MNNTEARIRLAEWMGLNFRGPTDVCGRPQIIYLTEKEGWRVFDPFTNDTDCMALVRALNERGIFVEITFFADGTCWVQIEGPNHHPRDRYEGDDYRKGVCELAMREIDDA